MAENVLFLAKNIYEILAKFKLKVQELALLGQEFFNFFYIYVSRYIDQKMGMP